MQKIELKHLAAYLPFKIDVIHHVYGKIKLEGLYLWGHLYNNEYGEIELEEIKPILRPLSDLTKEEYSGIYNLLRVHIGKRKLNTLINEGYGLIDLPYFIFENLLELHFDVFGFIEKGLAVDINTINK